MTRTVASRLLRAAVVATIVVGLSLAASTASAATPRFGALARWHRWNLARTGAAPRSAFGSVILGAGPKEVLIGGIRYEMHLSAFAFSGNPPFADIDLQRSLPLVGRPTAFQLHDYSLSPQSGATFTFARGTLATAALDMGSSIAPDTLAATFTASGPATQTPCRLVTGGHGLLRRAAGTLAYSAFGIDTSTTPFFGTLTAGPLHGRLTSNPGCNGVGAPAPNPRQCPGRESLDAATPTTEWSFDKAYGQPLVGEGAFIGSDPDSPSVTSAAHLISAETSKYTLPRPTHSLHGATARAFTEGDPFMTGTAMFTSTRAPVITRRHSCIAAGRTRHFNTYRYAGQLAPGATPMTAEFDTAPLALTPLSATLTLHIYP
jgi:hypothetical protein